jgi:hypothetical protein
MFEKNPEQFEDDSYRFLQRLHTVTANGGKNT